MHPVNKLLDTFGLRLIHVDRPGTPPGQDGSIRSFRLGGFDIRMPAHTFGSYSYHEWLNTEIGRLAAAVHERYPEMICIDVGANVGDTAAIIRGACPAPILCVEGDPQVARLLAENTAPLGDVRIVSSYLGEESGERRVIIDKAGWNSTLMPAEGGEGGVAVRFTTLDEVVDAADHSRVKLIKVDVEGYERRVLRGARRILGEGRPAVLFEHNRAALDAIGEDGAEIFADLRDLGYRSILFWDANDRFLLPASLDEMETVADLHEYVAFAGDRQLGAIIYLNACAFHRDDDDLAARCLAAERALIRARRPARTQPPRD